MLNCMPLYLASASPRRRELLALTGLPFQIDVADVDETCDLPPAEAVVELSRRKAKVCAARHPGAIILGSDTLVSLHGRALGKPADEADAFAMLTALRGEWNDVYTGVTVIDPAGQVHSALSESRVLFSNEMTDADIRAYIRTGEPMDKAGAYALQGIASLWIDRVEGSFSGVIGLPMELVRKLLTECGLPLLPEQRIE